MSVRIHSPTRADWLPIVDNHYAAILETGQEVDQVSVAETKAIIDRVLTDPTSRTRILVAQVGQSFVGHLAYGAYFCPDRNTNSCSCVVRIVGGFRGQGIGRQLLSHLDGIDLTTLLLPRNKAGIRLGQSVGLRAQGCRLITRKATPEQIEGYRRCYSVRGAARGEVATFVRGNEAFELRKATETAANHDFLVTATLTLSACNYGVLLNRATVSRGVNAALRASRSDLEDGAYFVLNRYAQDDEPVGFVWMIRDPSPYRVRPCVSIKIWIAPAYRRMRLAKSMIEAALGLFCPSGKPLELWGVLPNHRMITKTQFRIWEATYASLGFHMQGDRVLLEP
jgi:GNAT superfamily N-acetyltransferase